MSVKDMSHITVEQVLTLRKAAVALEQELAELKASLPSVRAEAVNSFELPEMDNINEWHHISECLKEHADKLEAGE